MKPIKDLAECDACGGTGCLVEEGKTDVAVVCARCQGIGAIDITYKKFDGLNKRGGVTKVRRSGSLYLSDDKDNKREVSYGDFLKGKRP